MYALSALGELESSLLILNLEELFTYPEIPTLPLAGYTSEQYIEHSESQSDPIIYCSVEVAELTECLFCTLPTVEYLIESTLLAQKSNPALDERELILLKFESELKWS